MNIDYFYLAIGVVALLNAIRLKFKEVAAKRREREMLERATLATARMKAGESRGKSRANERAWFVGNSTK